MRDFIYIKFDKKQAHAYQQAVAYARILGIPIDKLAIKALKREINKSFLTHKKLKKCV